MEERKRFEQGRREKGYYGYLRERYKELIDNNEREEYTPGLKGMAGAPGYEFVDGHDFTSFLDYHGETEGRTLLHYRKQAYSCLICRVCNFVTCYRQTSARFNLNCPSGDRFRYDNYFGQGKLQMIRGLIDGELSEQHPPAEPLKPIFKPTERFLHAVYTCTMCGGCESQCKIQKLLEPMHAARALREWLMENGVGPLPEHQALFKNMANYDNPWGGARAARTRWIPKELKVKELGEDKEKSPVLYYVGCTAAYVQPIQYVAAATVLNLQAAGVDFGILGRREVCCGSTMLRLGDRRGFEKYRDRNLEVLGKLGLETIVTSCAGCVSTLKEEYADKLNCEVLHIVEYLERLISQGKIKPKNKVEMKVTYHDPCHLGRYCGIYDPPRSILASIPGLKLIEMERIREDSYCCAAGGGVRTAYPEFAAWAATRRLTEARESTGCEVVATACPFCEENLTDAARPLEMKVIDVNQLLWDSLK